MSSASFFRPDRRSLFIAGLVLSAVVLIVLAMLFAGAAPRLSRSVGELETKSVPGQSPVHSAPAR
jgi:hypothetical protein